MTHSKRHTAEVTITPMSTAYELQLGAYPTPTNISYAWSYGSLAGLTMVVLVVSGFAIDTVYAASVDMVDDLLELINRDGVYGWFMRNIHANVPSLIFLWLYCHQSRSILIGTRLSYAWLTGWVIILLTIIVAFLGYSCVWGLMSYWAATVITSLVTVVPFGGDILSCLWGAPIIGLPTLTRFIALHYLLAIVVLALAAVHMAAVHYTGSSNPLMTGAIDKQPFVQYYVVKDAIGVALALLVGVVVVMGLPTVTMDTELYMLVNTMSTPEHIIPEWYLLPYYAVLRCVPSKAMGCVAAIGMLLLLLLLVVKQGENEADTGQ